MSQLSELAQSGEYLSFRSGVGLRRIVVDSHASKGWSVFDSGPRRVRCPLVCLPPVSGTADVFYRQVLALSARGVRVIAAEPPVYWSVREWCEGFKRLIDYLELDRVHLFGASLGGFLAQKFAEHTANCPRVASLILCNSFADTSIFKHKDSSIVFWLLPSVVLKRMLMGNFSAERADTRIVEAIDFMVEKLDSLSQQQLASRLTLNCLPNYVRADLLGDVPTTILDVFDEYALSSSAREELAKCYPHAKLAFLKSGGNFPYLSRCDEVNLHIQIHLRQFHGGSFSPYFVKGEGGLANQVIPND